MSERDFMTNPPEKVLLLYQAVADMINEGCDINSMKVSDITTRAGIGKGTAYEYFSSKEEIITQALFYTVSRQAEEILKIAENNETFQQKIYAIFDFLKENFKENRTFCQLVKLGTGAYDVSDSLKQEFDRLDPQYGCGQATQIIAKILQSGIQEGLITEKREFVQKMVFSSQIIMYAIYLLSELKGEDTQMSNEEAKEYVYQSMIKLLQ